MVPGFSVDVWFLYGSFAYGLEAGVVDYGPGTLKLVLLEAESTQTAADLSAFLESVTEHPRGLMRSELRIYGPRSLHQQAGLGWPVTVGTELAPVLESPCQLTFVNLRGVTEANEQHWHTLTHAIWPRLQS